MKNKLRLYYFLIGVLVALFISICACFAVISTGYVDTRRIVIYSGIAQKAYDGTPLTNENFGIKHGRLKKGHSLIVETYGSQTEKGASFNYFHYNIVDEEGNSVTNQYRVIETPGLLIVREEGWIDWDKIDPDKMQELIDRFGNYDFSSLDLDNMDLEELMKQLENQNWTDEQKEKLMQAIAAKVMASMMANQNLDTDGDGVPNYQDSDVNGNGVPNAQDPDVDGDGLPNAQDDDVDGDGMPNDIDNDIDGDGLPNDMDDDAYGSNAGVGQGGLGGAGNQRFNNNLQQEGDGSFGENADVEVLSLFSKVGGEYYLRYESFGDYNGRGFDIADEYSESVVSPLYFMGTALDSAGVETQQIIVENLDGSNAYYLPYYALTGGVNETGDVRFSQAKSQYKAKLVSYDYLQDGQIFTLPSDLVKQEQRYRNYVYNEYLEIDNYLADELKYLTGYFWGDKLSIARQIRDYVQHSASYNLNFERFPDYGDMVLYFLREGREGICQHFAAAGTMIFRAYGIPARYTCGYKVTAEPNTVTVVTDKYAHAWVEIYIDGMGWVDVEVTGGSFDEVRKNELTLTTASVSKVYDGQPIDFYEAVRWELEKGSLKKGHTINPINYEYVQMPTYACLPTINKGFDYEIVDEFGNDVSAEYDIKEVKFGTIEITKRPITVWASGNSECSWSVEEIKLPYNGEYQKSENYIFESIDFGQSRGLLNEHSVELLTATMAKDIGVHENIQTYRIVDWTNERQDVTSNYEIDAREGEFEIVKIKLGVETNPYNHQYDADFAIREDNKDSWQHYNLTYYNSNNIVDGHQIEVGDFEGVFNPVNVGETTENEFKIKILENGVDVSDIYYEIDYVFRKIEVEPRDITIYRGGAEADFDKVKELFNYDYSVDENVLLQGHSVKLTKEFVVSECGKYENKCEFGIIDGSGEFITENYNIMYSTKKGYSGELFLYKSITITAQSLSKVYDGTPLVYDKVHTRTGTPLSGHRLVIEKNSLTDVGSKESVSVKIITINGGEDVTNNYYKVAIKGSLKITPKQITVATKDVTYSYDGETTFTGKMEDLVVTGLTSGHSISDQLEFTGSISYYGECPNSFNYNTLKVVDASGKDVTKNYKIDVAFGTIFVDA